MLRALDDPPDSPHLLMGAAHSAVIPPASHSRDDPEWVQARAEAGDWVINQLGWRVEPDSAALGLVADVFLAARQVGNTDLRANLPAYADCAYRLAEVEVASSADKPGPAEMVTSVIVGTVLGEALLAGVRLLAHQDVSRRAEDGD